MQLTQGRQNIQTNKQICLPAGINRPSGNKMSFSAHLDILGTGANILMLSFTHIIVYSTLLISSLENKYIKIARVHSYNVI